MTLKEAVKSGKPFRHKSWANKCYYSKAEYVDMFEKGVPCRSDMLTIDEAVSDDWEIHEKTSYSKADVRRVAIILWQTYGSNHHNETEWINEATKAADREGV